jgi:hypothetical protein
MSKIKMGDTLKYYIEQLTTFLNNIYNFPERKRVVVDSDDLYMVNVYGHNDDHCFSVKLSKFPYCTICFYGYNLEETLALTEANYERVTKLIMQSINFGVVLSVYKNNEKINTYEFVVDKNLCDEDVKNIFNEIQRNDNKTAFPCTLVCSNFLGDNILTVKV